MVYTLEKTIYELLPEEQAKARFILKTVDGWQRSNVMHLPPPLDIEIQAFEKFKGEFYRAFARRIAIDCEPNPMGMSIIEEGKRIMHCEVKEV